MDDATLESDLSSLRARLTSEIESDNKQIEVLKRRIEKHQVLLNAVRGSLGVMRTVVEPEGYGSKAEMIREAIKRLPPHFTQDDVERQLRSLYPAMEINRNRVRASLWTSATKENGIRVTAKGNNHSPAIYEKIDHENGKVLDLNLVDDKDERKAAKAK